MQESSRKLRPRFHSRIDSLQQPTQLTPQDLISSFLSLRPSKPTEEVRAELERGATGTPRRQLAMRTKSVLGSATIKFLRPPRNSGSSPWAPQPNQVKGVCCLGQVQRSASHRWQAALEGVPARQRRSGIWYDAQAQSLNRYPVFTGLDQNGSVYLTATLSFSSSKTIVTFIGSPPSPTSPLVPLPRTDVRGF